MDRSPSTPRTVFITGAARGIGRACALRFAAAGWRVGAYDLDADALASTARELNARAAGGSSCHAHLDVCDPASIRAALEHFEAHAGGRVDVLVNNAGIMSVGRFEALDPVDMRRMIAVNLQGVIEVAHAAFPYLRDTPGARLINMSSASAIYGVPEMACYAATKHAVRGLTESLEVEWAAHDIRVCDVMPIFVRTALLTNTRMARAQAGLGVHLEPGDVAAAVYTAATSRWRRVHRPVGWQAKLAYHASGLSPTALERLVMRLLTRS
ncbi:SDR family oxidoreductase [Pseudenhygromyxa sp. WMMC2535]|uniref:SDR family oxidoreductase n=1 Tax=Pseudenhygromyxa sp. WMMC2535 TaxID=2712867 RepID=UPI0015526916|nr:SDR family oxidoreductase [Pseudenhygromyxa sp. WMMC2535]NVB43388.1 SDR family oxidoreductase [Pseudenhygromyxa sp. WMMC2535]